jgi:heat shock protein HslJ
MHRLLALVLPASLFVLTACASAPTAATSQPMPEGLAFTLTGLRGAPVTGNAPTLRIEGGRAAGSDGCNRYSVPATVRGSAIEFGPRGMSTQMACPPEAMKQAETFIAALNAARTYTFGGEELTLLDADRKAVATFKVVSQALAGTRWKAVNVNNGRGAVTSLVNGSEITLAFGTDGRVSGSAGCNRYTGSYTQAGGKLAFGPPAATRMACPQPDGVMEQEAAFLKALATVATGRVEADRLELRSADGALMAMFTRAPN